MKTLPKDKSSVEYRGRLNQLLKDFNIHFEGPVPPSRWPPKERHLFNVIREIWSERYDESQHNISRELEDRVHALILHASALRTDSNPVESDWRINIEDDVFQRFKKSIVW
jgi:hypothetical protein